MDSEFKKRKKLSATELFLIALIVVVGAVLLLAIMR
jgi:hypothetical protein